jgi:hypothetical protein
MFPGESQCQGAKALGTVICGKCGKALLVAIEFLVYAPTGGAKAAGIFPRLRRLLTRRASTPTRCIQADR